MRCEYALWKQSYSSVLGLFISVCRSLLVSVANLVLPLERVWKGNLQIGWKQNRSYCFFHFIIIQTFDNLDRGKIIMSSVFQWGNQWFLIAAITIDCRWSGFSQITIYLRDSTGLELSKIVPRADLKHVSNMWENTCGIKLPVSRIQTPIQNQKGDGNGIGTSQTIQLAASWILFHLRSIIPLCY